MCVKLGKRNASEVGGGKDQERRGYSSSQQNTVDPKERCPLLSLSFSLLRNPAAGPFPHMAPSDVVHASSSDSKRSASSAAMHPDPAEVTAWRYTLSCTSPAAKTPLTEVFVVPGTVRMYP